MRRALSACWLRRELSASSRRVSTFAELYGREPNEDTGIGAAFPSVALHTPSTSDSVPPVTSSAHLSVAAVLSQYDDQHYADPSRHDAGAARDTLRAVRHALIERRTSTHESDREVSHVWLKALAIVTDATNGRGSDAGSALQATPAAALAATSECVAVLWTTRRKDAARDLAEQTLLALGTPSLPSTALTSSSSSSSFSATVFLERLTTTEAFCGAVALLTAWVLGSCDAQAPMTKPLAPTIETLLRESRQRAQDAATKEDKAHVAQACAGLVWALDWVWHMNAALLPPAWTAATLRTRSLPWMTHTFDKAVTTSSAFALQSPPSHLFLAAEQCATLAHSDETHGSSSSGGGETLKRLYMSAVTRARDTPALFLFDLPQRLGAIVLAAPRVPSATKAAVVHALGTSLAPSALEAYGATTVPASSAARATHPLDDSVRVLARMCGPDAYHALRRLGRASAKPHLLATVQNMYGDVLSPVAGVTWQSALAAVSRAMQDADATSWRRTLPTTLRLLADAEKPTAFFSLLREYRPEGSANAVVAASLATVMHQTGRWWHALEVVDLIADANLPQSESDDIFLRDAALETLTALRHAHRWKEALSVMTALGPLLSAPASADAASSTIWSTVVEMPRGAPWQEAVALVARTFPPRKSATTLINLTRAEPEPSLTKLPGTEKARQRLFFLLSSHGRWQTLASGLALIDDDDGHAIDSTRVRRLRSELWRHILRALQHSPQEDDLAAVRRLLTAMPMSCLVPDNGHEASAMLRHVFRVCERLGCLDVLDSLLARARSPDQMKSGHSKVALLCGEYVQLLSFLEHGTTTTSTAPPARSDKNEFSVSDRFVVQQFLRHVSSRHFRIQYLWVSATRKGQHFLQSKSKQAATVQLARDFGCRPDQVRIRPRGRGDCVWLFPPTPLPFTADDLYASTDGAVVAFKPFGAVLSQVAVAAVVETGRRESFTPLFDMPPGWSGLFVLRPSTRRQAGVTVRLELTVRVVPLAGETVPLMATPWWTRYCGRVRATADAAASASDALLPDGGPAPFVTVECTISTDGSDTVDDVLRQWRTSLNADGWGVVEGEGGVSGESAHVFSVSVAEPPLGGVPRPVAPPADVTTATTTVVPHWLAPFQESASVSSEAPLPADEAFDEDAFLAGDDGDDDDADGHIHS